MAWLGTVDLVMDKKHKLTVGTGLASCLFIIDQRKSISNQDLAEQMGGLEPDLMRKLIEPLFAATVVTETMGKYSIEVKSDVKPAQFAKVMISNAAETYTTLLGRTTGAKITLATDSNDTAA